MNTKSSAAFSAMEAMLTANRGPGRRIPTENCRNTFSHTIGTSPGAKAIIMGRARASTSLSTPKTGNT